MPGKLKISRYPRRLVKEVSNRSPCGPCRKQEELKKDSQVYREQGERCYWYNDSHHIRNTKAILWYDKQVRWECLAKMQIDTDNFALSGCDESACSADREEKDTWTK
jgi:hypothetical protein